MDDEDDLGEVYIEDKGFQKSAPIYFAYGTQFNTALFPQQTWIAGEVW